jgi:subtilisin family serine protease
MANRGSYIDFAAPGVGIWTAVPDGGRVQSGTSFAVPYVSAQIAVEIAGGAASRPEVMRELLRNRAVDMGSPGKDDDYGWGFVAEEPSCG